MNALAPIAPACDATRLMAEAVARLTTFVEQHVKTATGGTS